MIRPTQWERIGFEPIRGSWFVVFGLWSWHQVRLTGLHLVRAARNHITYGWMRPYKVNTTSGKRSWLERPY